MYINKTQIRKFYHNNNKRITKEALKLLDKKVENILFKSIELVRNFKTVTNTEISFILK